MQINHKKKIPKQKKQPKLHNHPQNRGNFKISIFFVISDIKSCNILFLRSDLSFRSIVLSLPSHLSEIQQDLIDQKSWVWLHDLHTCHIPLTFLSILLHESDLTYPWVQMTVLVLFILMYTEYNKWKICAEKSYLSLMGLQKPNPNLTHSILKG